MRQNSKAERAALALWESEGGRALREDSGRASIGQMDQPDRSPVRVRRALTTASLTGTALG